MNLFLAYNSETRSWFSYSSGPGEALGPNETAEVIEAKKCLTFDEIVKAIPKGYHDRYDIQRWTFKVKETY
jgi:hypothetical protein